MSTAHPQDSNPEKSKRLNWIALAAAVVLAFIVTKACQPEPKPTMDEVKESILAETTTPSATEKPSTNATSSTTEKDAMPWLKSQFGAEPGEVLAQNPALWYGYVAGAYVEGSRLHVQLQVDRKADKQMGADAAKALASFVSFSDDPVVAGVDWALAEDGTGVVIEQEKVRNS